MKRRKGDAPGGLLLRMSRMAEVERAMMRAIGISIAELCYDARMTRVWGGLTLVFVAAMAAGGCSASILHGVDERSANEATAALERAGIGAEKLPDEGAPAAGGATYTIRVAHADGTRAVDLLRALGLPHD